MSISLKTIILYDFKSFRGEVIIGPIQSFTAIIGPNGSGKSNIMDAIRFVLGEKSSALRVKHLSQLIYGASRGNPISHSAYVTGIFVLDDLREKSFTRMIQGQNSQYKIDDKIVTCDSYMRELRELGLDIRSGNFMVSQGYIEDIAMKSPKERTMMLEQISGSIAYKADYDRLKMELTKIEDEVRFVYEVKKQLLIQKKCALAEKTEAERYVKLQKKYIKIKSEFQLIQLLFIKRNVEVLQDEQGKNKSKGDDNLRDQTTAMSLLRSKELQLAPLSNSLEAIEQAILEQENIIKEKKTEAVIFTENNLYLQKKKEFATTSLNTANKARDANKKVIQELKDDLKQISNKLVQLQEIFQEGSIEFSNSQIEKYMKLKNMTEHQAKDYIIQINHLICEQQIDHDKFDNENRGKQESEGKAKQTALMKQDLKERLRKLQDLSVETRAILMEKIAIKEELAKKLVETNERLPHLENNIAKISEELREATIDNDITLHKVKQTNTIQLLKQSFSGVHGRLSSMCKPIHSRYDIAVTKVFGKNMNAIVVDTMHIATQCIQFLKQQKIGVETFLPLDSLEFKPLNKELRSIEEPKGVKLLYDVLHVSSTQIYNAILFVIKNTLVCETSEDARRVAYELNKNTNYDCVSLDGCFYRRDGTFSGGQIDLIVKAKQWKRQQISALEDQKIQLIQEYKNLPKILSIQSEINIIDIQINGLTVKEKYIHKDIRDVEDNLDKMRKELAEYNMELRLLSREILKIQQNMQKRDEKIKDLEMLVNEIKDEMFSNFCEDMNIPDISYYEKNNLQAYQEQENKRMELKTQCDRIEEQLHFESKRDTGSKIAKWEYALQTANANLNQAHQQEHLLNIAIEQKELKLIELQNNHKTIKADIQQLQMEIGQRRSIIDVISKSYLRYQKEYITLQKKIEQKKMECSIIFKDCKIEDITIPILLDRQDRSDREILSFMNLSCLSEMSDSQIFLSIDFSQFPENIRNATEETLQDTTKQLEEKLTNIQSELEPIICPNLKAHQKFESVTQEIRHINAKLEQLREKSHEIKKQFELVKGKRYKLLADCLESINAEIDIIYKSLVNDKSVQAVILPDDSEEPYAGGINYICIAPFKCFQPLEYLSGGEKSLASLALLFATHRYKKVPFFIMDEGDAALDKTNIKNVIRFIRSHTDDLQFITITLNNSLYSYANAVIGVTMTEEGSGLYVISLNEYKMKQI